MGNNTDAVQYGEGGGKWGRRRPRWLMVERAYLHNLWRASQAAHKWWATPDTPSAPLTSIPPMHKVGPADSDPCVKTQTICSHSGIAQHEACRQVLHAQVVNWILCTQYFTLLMIPLLLRSMVCCLQYRDTVTHLLSAWVPPTLCCIASEGNFDACCPFHSKQSCCLAICLGPQQPVVQAGTTFSCR